MSRSVIPLTSQLLSPITSEQQQYEMTFTYRKEIGMRRETVCDDNDYENANGRVIRHS
jgi:hypothetical protein